MSSKVDRKDSLSSSQLIVEDPEAFLQQLKQRLALKEGIPESQQRLVFSVPQSPKAPYSAATTARSAEEIVGELGSWQAILFQNDKAIGRLLAPQLSSAQTQEENWSFRAEGAGWEKKSCVVEIISIFYTKWQPVWLKNKGASRELYLPVDGNFAESQFRLQVIGRSGGRPFVIPCSYQFAGREVSIALSLEVQRAEYIKRHQQVRGAGAAPLLRNIAVECGKGLEGFTAIFDAEDQPAWLKGVALHFAVVASRVFDDAAPSRCQPIPTERPESNPAAKGKPVDSQKEVAKESWLPKMSGSVSSGKKTKSKQKSKVAAARSREAVGKAGREPTDDQSGNDALVAGRLIPSLAGEIRNADRLAEGGPKTGKPSTAGGAPLRGRSEGLGEKPAEGQTGQNRPVREHPADAGGAPGHGEGQEAAPNSRVPAVPAPFSGRASKAARQGTGFAGPCTSPAAVQDASRGIAAVVDRKLGVEGGFEAELPPSAFSEQEALEIEAIQASQGGDCVVRSRRKAPPKLAVGEPDGSDSDGSLFTATSELPPSSSNTSANSAGLTPAPATAPESVEVGSAGSASFLTFGSYDSASGDEGGTPQRASEPPLSNGTQGKQPGKAGRSPIRSKPSHPDSATPTRLPRTAGTPSSSASNLPSLSTPPVSASGRPEAVPFLPQGQGEGEPSGLQIRQSQNFLLPNGSGLTAELHHRNMLPYDPLSMVGSPISPKDFGSWAQKDTAGWGHLTGARPSMPSTHSHSAAELAPGDQAASTSGGDSGLPDGFPNMFAATQGTSALPNGPNRIQLNALDSNRAAEASRRPSSASRPSAQTMPEWPIAARGTVSSAALPGYTSFQPPSRGPDLQRGPPQSLPASTPQGAAHPNNRAGAAPEAWSRQHEVPPAAHSRPFSANAPGNDGGTGSRPRSYDSAVDPSARALMADLRQARAAAAAADMGMGRIMTPPPPPPPRTPPLHGEMDGYEHGIERQGSFQMPPPPYRAVFDSHGLPTNDMERLMSSITPILEVEAGTASRELRLADVWRFFEESSLYGREVYTRSGKRGPALAYYTPTLSAIRVLLPCEVPPGAHKDKVHAEPLVQHFEAELPFNREPFTDAVASLSIEPGMMCPEERLEDLRLSDLHPESWFAVAWYPVYRIPDAPLTTKFLTFHSLRPTPASCTFFGAADPLRSADGAAEDASVSPLCAPLLGLRCAEQKGETWLESYNRTNAPRGEWQRRLQQLQAKANSLSSGQHLRLRRQNGDWEPPRQSHSDLEWFSRHP